MNNLKFFGRFGKGVFGVALLATLLATLLSCTKAGHSSNGATHLEPLTLSEEKAYSGSLADLSAFEQQVSEVAGVPLSDVVSETQALGQEWDSIAVALKENACTVTTHQPTAEKAIFTLSVDELCPWHLIYQVAFGYNFFRGRVTVDLKFEFYPKRKLSKAYHFRIASAALIGGGEHQFSGNKEDAQVSGSYRFGGTLTNSEGKQINLTFLNQIAAKETLGRLGSGQSSSVLTLSSEDYSATLKGRSLFRESGREDYFFQNGEALDSEKATRRLDQLGLFSPHSLSAMGRSVSSRR